MFGFIMEGSRFSIFLPCKNDKKYNRKSQPSVCLKRLMNLSQSPSGVIILQEKFCRIACTGMAGAIRYRQLAFITRIMSVAS